MPFTGIVEEKGTVVSFEESTALKLWDGSIGTGVVIEIGCNTVLNGAYIGCSIAVNGVCLTVTALSDTSFTINCAPETLRLTNLGSHKKGSQVNLERAMAGDGRNSGHMVQGHVDGTASVVSSRPDGEALWVTMEVPRDMLKYIVKKGYIAIDGTSLTVTEVNHSVSQFSVMLIAHTQNCITLPHKSIGELVNIEVDIVGKYVAATVGPRLEAIEESIANLSAGSGRATSAGPIASNQEATASSPQGATRQDTEMTAINRQIKVTNNQHGAGLKLPLPSKELAKTLKIGIVRTCWHSELIDLMEWKCIAELIGNGVQKDNIYRTKVSGSFELPYTCGALATEKDLDAVVAIGILLKGGTIHMEVIANAVTKNILDIQCKINRPIIFGILTVFSLDQAKERAESDLGGSWGQAALAQAMVKRGEFQLEPLD